MQYVVGIDGGGTKTRMKLADMDGGLLACFEGGPANINTVGIEGLEKVLKELTSQGLEKIGGDFSGCMTVCLGMAGAGRSADKAVIRDILQKIGFNTDIIVTDDAFTALYGGIGSGEGVILISGTGSICYGRDSLGQTRRAGGWGYIAGDEGSGYDIGLHALKHAVRSLDGREAASLLADMVMDQIKLTGMDVVQLVYRSGVGKNAIAQLAPLVDAAFAEGDSFAEKILRNAVEELMLSVKSVVDGLCLRNGHFQLALGGSVLDKSNYVTEGIIKRMSREYPSANVFKAKNDAAWGAVRIALDHITNRDQTKRE
jgi:N-acetylglucosamine kinase-like BadF-type ATPase